MTNYKLLSFKEIESIAGKLPPKNDNFMFEWYAEFADYLIEAYQAGHAFFADYLDGKRPFLWHHYFELHYFKQFVKRLLKRG